MSDDLTLTQRSALADLARFGYLQAPQPGERIERGTVVGFSRRTLQSLVDQSLAHWSVGMSRIYQYPGPHQPADPDIATFKTNYMDAAFADLQGIIDRASAVLADVDFDTFVGTGFSGGVVIPPLALAMGKNFALVRKDNDDSHHGAGVLVGSLGRRWIFVDDFVSSGTTRDRVTEKVECAARIRTFNTTRVGSYYYTAKHLNSHGWNPGQ